jgi:uncharacterized protein
MKVAITGSSGLIGSALVPHLRAEGHDVVRFVRGDARGQDERSWDPDNRHLDPRALDDVDAVVHLAGAGVADKRWTRKRKAVVLASRVNGTTAVAQAVAAAERTRVLLSASAVGWYGDTGDRRTDETGSSGEGFLADTCRQWEAATGPAADAGARVALLRTGIVLSGRGGALGPQLPIFKAGLGAPLGNGRQYVPWISLPDEVAAIAHLLTAEVSGPVNLVGPGPVTNREFTEVLGRVLRRPTLPIPVPGPALRVALGQFASEGVLIGQRLQPAVLEQSGFTWQHEDLETALRAVLDRPGTRDRRPGLTSHRRATPA